MNSVVVTGVSTGIGYAITKFLIANGICVFGSVRHANDAERLSKEFGSLYVPLIFDITDEEKVKQAALMVRERLKGKKLWGLINNAGISIAGPLLHLPIKSFKNQLDVNLTGQLIVTQAFAPLLGADETLTGPPGKIINISSVLGIKTQPFLGAYAIAKHGLEAFSETLRVELMIFGIDVVTIGPGMVQSMIWQKEVDPDLLAQVDKSVYCQSVKKFSEFIYRYVDKNALNAEVIAHLALQILNAKNPRMRYVRVPNKFQYFLFTYIFPKRMTQWLIAKKLGLLKK